MLRFPKWLYGIIAFLSLIIPVTSSADSNTLNIPILCYHNFNPTRIGSMNMTPRQFEAELIWLKEKGFTVIPLKAAVDYLQGKPITLPPKPVVVSVDDGWQSAYTYLLPIIKKHRIPVTLFIYPQTISNGKNALTWEQLKELQKTGFFNIQSHTYSHPNFKQEKRHLSASAYEKFVTRELVSSKKILEEKFGQPITLLAWPFGIYDPYLEQQAAKAGYTMAFSIDARKANQKFRPMAQPRYMILATHSMPQFAGIVSGPHSTKTTVAAH